jgi:hypothetical protein
MLQKSSKMKLFWLNAGFSGLKMRQKTRFAVTHSLLCKIYKVLKMRNLKSIPVLKNSLRRVGGVGVDRIFGAPASVLDRLEWDLWLHNSIVLA